MNITELKQELVNIEVSIKAITGEEIDSLTDWMHCVEKRGKVETLLQQRSVLLNKMFAATFGEIEHFKQVNEMLYNLTLQLFNRVKSLSNSCEKIADTAFDDDTEVCGTLSVVVECKSDILTLDNDDYYGSDFLLMNHILYLIYNEKNSSVEWFYARAIDGEEKPMCDDGVSWDEYPFNDRKEFRDIVICHAAHDMCSHKMFSIPDLLRINNYWAEAKLTLQKFATQSA